jgi:hypothetical protein
MKTLQTALLALVLGLAGLAASNLQPRLSAGNSLALFPVSLKTSSGRASRQPVSVLAAQDQAGSQDDPAKYIRLETPKQLAYDGVLAFELPKTLRARDIAHISITVNFRGPLAAQQGWEFQGFHWEKREWIRLGNQQNVNASLWSEFRLELPSPAFQFASPDTGRIQLRIQSTDAGGEAALDYAAARVSVRAPAPTRTPPPHWTPPLEASWHIQYTGEIDTSLDMDIYNLDLFDTPPESIEALRARGVRVMCYFSAGSYEDWRPDAGEFPAGVLGKALEGWPGEKWLDIRQIGLLAPIMEARLDLARDKGCDGVDPDNVNGYTNDSGFPLTGADQIAYNIFLADAAHQRGLGIGLKNDLEQVAELLPYFDWQVNEQCFLYDECGLLLPFIAAGKPVFNIEYELTTAEFCAQANAYNFNSIRKNLALDEYAEACR